MTNSTNDVSSLPLQQKAASINSEEKNQCHQQKRNKSDKRRKSNIRKRKREGQKQPPSNGNNTEQSTKHIKLESYSSTPASTTTDASIEKENIRKGKETIKPLNGLTLAISTLDVKGEKHASSNSSYKSVSNECISLGASVTGQVHKRVFAVICNKSAVYQATQRVRKALKKKHLLIDVEWVRECRTEGHRVSYDLYLLNELAKEVIDSKNEKDSESGTMKNKVVNEIEFLEGEESTMNDYAGWSEPVSLDCCCACHETDRLDCKWCVSCNVNKAKKAKLALEES